MLIIQHKVQGKQAIMRFCLFSKFAKKKKLHDTLFLNP